MLVTEMNGLLIFKDSHQRTFLAYFKTNTYNNNKYLGCALIGSVNLHYILFIMSYTVYLVLVYISNASLIVIDSLQCMSLL